jgi:hypothetical protein
MFELADKMVGIYKTNDETQTLTVIPRKMQELIDEERENRNINQ